MLVHSTTREASATSVPGSYGKTCTRCGTYYDEAAARFLYSDETGGYCPCGGRLLESVEPEGERHYRLFIPEPLEGSAMHRELARRSGPGISVEVSAESSFISLVVEG
jgi:hypothetical protein